MLVAQIAQPKFPQIFSFAVGMHQALVSVLGFRLLKLHQTLIVIVRKK